MYEYYSKLNHSDSANDYKNRILSHIADWEVFIYEDLLKEIDPDDLRLYDECKPAHNQGLTNSLWQYHSSFPVH